MISRLLLAASAILIALPLASQVRHEDILQAPGENWLTFTGDYSAIVR